MAKSTLGLRNEHSHYSLLHFPPCLWPARSCACIPGGLHCSSSQAAARVQTSCLTARETHRKIWFPERIPTIVLEAPKAESDATSWSFLWLSSLCSSASSRLAGFFTLSGFSASYSMQTLAVPLALLGSSGSNTDSRSLTLSHPGFTGPLAPCHCTHWISSSLCRAGGCPILWHRWRCQSWKEVRSRSGQKSADLATRWSLLGSPFLPSSQLASGAWHKKTSVVSLFQHNVHQPIRSVWSVPCLLPLSGINRDTSAEIRIYNSVNIGANSSIGYVSVSGIRTGDRYWEGYRYQCLYQWQHKCRFLYS